MQEIRCPKCNEVFQVDDSGYSQIVQQVRDKEFEKEAARRAEELEKAKNSELKILEMEYEKKLESALSEKSDDITDKEKRITELEARLKSIESEKQLAVANAVRERENSFSEESRKAQKAISDKDIEIAELTAKLKQADNERAFAVDKANSEKESLIKQLELQLQQAQSLQQAALDKVSSENALVLAKKDNEINELNSKLRSKDNEAELRCRSIEEKYAIELKNKDELIEQYKDFKARLSTKMVGETLEQHCLTQFNSLRTSAFPNAYFEKDNDARSGSKGDFIFRESSDDGIEFISIMFEMKNEMDTTATKHKNEDFFKELD